MLNTGVDRQLPQALETCGFVPWQVNGFFHQIWHQRHTTTDGVKRS